MTGAAFDRVLDALRAAGRPVTMEGPNRARSSCPAHEGDNRTALSVVDTADRVNLHCFTRECDGADVLAALGLTVRDRYHEPRGDTLARYQYPGGFTVTRTMGADGNGKGFTASTGWAGRPRPLYRGDRIPGAVAAGLPVYLVEGEEDVHAVEAAEPGVVAVSAPHGAASFAQVDPEPLRGAVVVAVVDRDTAGDRWAADVRATLDGVALVVRFVRAASGKDVSDHIAAGRTLADLEPYEGPRNPEDDPQGESDFHPEPEGAAHDAPPSWAPVDLGPILDGTRETVQPSLLPRSDGVCLVYAGLTHSFHGESESGKSLVLQLEAVRLLALGFRVLFVDFESDAASVVGRLLEFGADPDAVRRLFVYVRPEVRPDTGRELHAWLDVLTGRFALAIIDGVTDSLGMFGYSTKDNDDVTAWSRELPRRIANRTGAAVVLVDHVTKDSESRGRFAIGGQAKLSGLTGAAYTVEVARPLGRGLRGVVVLRVGKDRPGYVRGHAGPMRASDRTQEVARVIIDSTGPASVVTVEPWQGRDSDPDAPARRWRPTAIMEALSRVLEVSDKPLSFRALDEAAPGRAEHKRAALVELDEGGFVTITDGPRRAKLHASARPYRQAADPRSDVYEPRDTVDPLDPASDPAIECVTVSRPYTGERDTHTQHPLTVSGTQSGHGGDTVTQTPANGSGTQWGPDGTRWGLEPPEPPENLPTRDLPTSSACAVCRGPLAAVLVAEGYRTHPGCNPDEARP